MSAAGMARRPPAAEVLARARAHFGRDYFDRLLYTVAAPGVSPGVRPDSDDEYRAAWIESGCQSEAASLLVTAASTAAPASPRTVSGSY